MFRGRIKNIHFVGIGGSGMSGIAEVLLNMGYRVTGSDLRKSKVTERLASLGALVYEGHARGNIKEADCVVYSSAVRMDNPELEEARRLGIPIIPRAEMLSELMRMKYGIAIAGTHGKTTTTSMVASILSAAGLDPTVVIGGRLLSTGSNARLGGGEFLVAEADESDGSFLKLSPVLSVITNIDREHMEHYRDMDEVKRAYVEFANRVPFYGCTLLYFDHPVIQDILPQVKRRYRTYGLSPQADIHATAVEQKRGRTRFDVVAEEELLGRVEIGLPGEHNVCNALAAVGIALELEIDKEKIVEGLRSFRGVERRFQIKADIGGVLVVDDYGHHPVEIRAVLGAIKKNWQRRTVAVFQPHRYSRTRDLFMDFVHAFSDADVVVLTEIYPAGEEPIEGVSSKALYEAMKEAGYRNIHYIERSKDVALLLESAVRRGDMVITLGAGDIWQAGERFVRLLEKRNSVATG